MTATKAGMRNSRPTLSTTTRSATFLRSLRHPLFNSDTDPVAKQLLDHLEDQGIPTRGGYILDWHACDLFPESWIDLVVVLRADSSLIYDRLNARGYGERKLQENLDSEIWGVLLEEAREAYAEEIVVELKSEEADDVEANVERIEGWIGKWEEDREGQEGGVKITGMAQE